MKISLNKTKRVFRAFAKMDDGLDFITYNGETVKGEWVTGAPLTKWDPCMPGVSQTFIIHHNGTDATAKWYNVIWETIGQYTGVGDFYEDDIVEFEGKLGIIKFDKGSMFVQFLNGRHEPTFCMMVEEYPDLHVVANIWQPAGVVDIEVE